MNKKVFSFLLVLTIVLLMVTISFAQQTTDPTGPPDPTDPASPIDGGVGFLLAAGLIYGVHKYKKSRKS